MDPKLWMFDLNDEMWVILPTAALPEGLTSALETLVIPFGSRSWSVRKYLEEWASAIENRRPGFSLGTASAGVDLLPSGDVNIVDMYGQFDDGSMAFEDFRKILEGLATAMDG
ncbi:hypothetical protein [Kitasatospora sp. NBC_00315]|uniref:hypothetical protein n=1 Tax=Kitasatospora sp. NBC_00315 TaxID=2975963 RepID=UPI003244C70E